MKPQTITTYIKLALICTVLTVSCKNVRNFKEVKSRCESLDADTIPNQIIIQIDASKVHPDTIMKELMIDYRTYNLEVDTIRCSCNPEIYLLEIPEDIEMNIEESLTVAEDRLGQNGLASFNFNIDMSFDAKISDTSVVIETPSTPPGEVVVAVMDDGINWKYSTNFDNKRWENDDSIACVQPNISGYDFTDDPINFDQNELNHGTLVASIIATAYPTEIDLQLMDLRIFDRNSKSTLFDAICATHYAIDHGADVINMSFGYYKCKYNEMLYNAFRKANAHNAIIVASAGNDGMDTDCCRHHPSYFQELFDPPLDNVISVAALEAGYDILAGYSNYGKRTVGIAANGRAITQMNDSYVAIQEAAEGTSYAAPLVTRIASILTAIQSSEDEDIDFMTNSEIVECIFEEVKIPADRLQVKTEGILNEERCLNNCQ